MLNTPTIEEDVIRKPNQRARSARSRSGGKRFLPGPERVVVVPVTESQLNVLKVRAREALATLQGILDLDFVKEIEKKHVANIISARGDLKQFLKCAVTRGRSRPMSARQPKKKPRLSANETSTVPWNRLQGQGWTPSTVPRSLGTVNRWPRSQFIQPKRLEWPSSNANEYAQPRSRAVNPVSRDLSQNWSSRTVNHNSFSRPRKRAGTLPRRSIAKRDVFCYVCNLNLQSKASFDQHVAGKKHRAKLLGESPNDRKRPRSGKVKQPVMHEIVLGGVDEA